MCRTENISLPACRFLDLQGPRHDTFFLERYGDDPEENPFLTSQREIKELISLSAEIAFLKHINRAGSRKIKIDMLESINDNFQFKTLRDVLDAFRHRKFDPHQVTAWSESGCFNDIVEHDAVQAGYPELKIALAKQRKDWRIRVESLYPSK